MAQAKDQAQKGKIAVPRRLRYNPRDIWTPFKKRGKYRPEVQVQDGEESEEESPSGLFSGAESDSEVVGCIDEECGSDTGIEQPQGIGQSQESQPAPKARKRKVKP